MKHIVAAIDFSDVTESVIGKAQELACAFSARLTLLHAVTNPDFVGYETGPQTVRDSRAHELRSERKDLEERVKALRESGIEADSKFVLGPIVETILEEVKMCKIDLIVVGSHGHGILHHVLVGSITEGILRQSPCPVLAVPAAKSKE